MWRAEGIRCPLAWQCIISNESVPSLCAVTNISLCALSLAFPSGWFDYLLCLRGLPLKIFAFGEGASSATDVLNDEVMCRNNLEHDVLVVSVCDGTLLALLEVVLGSVVILSHLVTLGDILCHGMSSGAHRRVWPLR